MTRSIHEHQWVYLGDLALTVSHKENDVSLRRLETCIECGTLRAEFNNGWYIMRPEATKQFLEKFDGEVVGLCIESPPQEFRIRPPSRSQRRLGRSLTEMSHRLTALPGGKKNG